MITQENQQQLPDSTTWIHLAGMDKNRKKKAVVGFATLQYLVLAIIDITVIYDS